MKLPLVFSKMTNRYFHVILTSSCLLFIAHRPVFGLNPDNGNKASTAALSTDRVDSSIIAHLSIARNYLVYPDSNVFISQVVTDSLTGELDSIRFFSEYIYYDKNILELVDVLNGARMPLPDWSVGKTVVTPGVVQITAVSSGAALHAPGEIIRLSFHVLSDAQPFATSDFIDSIPVLGRPSDPIVIADTGQLLVVDACVPVLSQSVTPTASMMEFNPNPATDHANISYFIAGNLSTSNHALFQLYNATGNLMLSINNAKSSIGWHTLPLDLSQLSNGVYTLEFQAGAIPQFQLLVILH